MNYPSLGAKVLVSHIYQPPPESTWEAGEQVQLEPVENSRASEIAVVVGATNRAATATVEEKIGGLFLAFGAYRAPFVVVRYSLRGGRYLTKPECITPADPQLSEAALQRLTADLKDLDEIVTTPEEDLQAEVLALRSDNRLLQERLAASEAALIGERASESFVSLSGARAEEIRRQVCSGLLDGAFQLVRCKTVPGVLLADALIEGAEAVVKHIVALEQKIERQRGQLEQKDAELRLKADLAAATQRAGAAEAGAAAMRMALEAERAYEAHTDNCEACGEIISGTCLAGCDDAVALWQRFVSLRDTALADSSGAALLEKQQRVAGELETVAAWLDGQARKWTPGFSAICDEYERFAAHLRTQAVTLRLPIPAPAPGGEQHG